MPKKKLPRGHAVLLMCANCLRINFWTDTTALKRGDKIKCAFCNMEAIFICDPTLTEEKNAQEKNT